MPSKRLHLKRTPAEQAEHDLRKARKAARKASRRHARANSNDPQSDARRPHSGPSRAHANIDDDDDDDIFARVEEERFREKMADAAVEDEYTSNLHARFESYGGRVPRRWQTGGTDEVEVDPWAMEEEEYAEWVRAGMWRKKHAAAAEEQLRRKAAHEAAQAEAQRALRAKDEARAQRRRERALRRAEDTRATYEARWQALLLPSDAPLRFADVPWPIFDSDELLPDAIATFVFHGDHAGNRKDALRQTLLRFHPDKFETRVLGRVVENDRERVREAVGAVVRAVGALMASSD